MTHQCLSNGLPPGRSSVPLAQVRILGVDVTAVDLNGAVSEIERWVAEGSHHYVCVTGVHGVMESRRNRQIADMHNNAGLIVADGMPLVWLAHRVGARGMGHVRGADLMRFTCRMAAQHGWSSFLYGGGPGCAEALARSLSAEIPGFRIAGTFTPPFRDLSPEEDEECIRRINSSHADLVWVGLSTPKQERWMATHTGRLRPPVLLGVGAAFDILAGLRPEAPRWVRDSGFEWLFRLKHEPWRLWRRYLRNNPAFVYRCIRERPVFRPAPSAPSAVSET